MKFGFIAKHRGIWPADWLCEVLGVSRGGFYAWLTRPRSQRSRDNEEYRASTFDPEAADALTRKDQAAKIEELGGREAILAKGSFGYSPVPGTKPIYN